MGAEMGLGEARQIIADQTFVIDVSSIRKSDGTIIVQGHTFINSLLSFTFGKVHFVSTEGKSAMMTWLDENFISSHPAFSSQQVWEADMSAARLTSLLNNANPGHVILITPSAEESRQALAKAASLRTIEFDPQNLVVEDLWSKLLSRKFWS